ncbi:hypothetical protein [Pantoea sp.]|uniref:hypothetical protein n=1 Tax=Pantoea sp. TaxID=69393 RepID=UPI0028AB311D|nr:hypothetical protein [Pantoea sp.]
MRQGKEVTCPACGGYAIVSKHPAISPTTGSTVPCYIYTCEKDGWFKLSESVNELVTNNPSPETAEKLSRIIAKNYISEDIWPAEALTPMFLIELNDIGL